MNESVSLRTQLVQTALAWESRFGIAPAITSALSEYDAAMLLGCSDLDYKTSLKDRTAVSKGYDFEFSGKRYQVKANRPSGKRGSRVTLVAKPRNYDWDYLIWVLYNSQYDIQEAWLLDLKTYQALCEEGPYLRPHHLRCGKSLISIPFPPSSMQQKKERPMPHLEHTYPQRKQILDHYLHGKLKGQCVHYVKTRLYLDRAEIESLSPHKPYLILEIEPTLSSEKAGYVPGYYILDKHEFETLFGQHTETHSWKTKGCFHFPKPPQKASELFIEKGAK